MAQNSNLLSINNILQHVIPSIMVYHNNRLPLPEVHKNSHATARCLTSCIIKYKTLPSPGVYAKESSNNTLPSPVAPAKIVTQQRVAFPGGKQKTITQQHVAFTSDTRKNSHSTTRHPHQWKTQNKTRNNTLPSPVVHAKQSRNKTLPSPVVHAK